jgi:hypothetical protein
MSSREWVRQAGDNYIDNEDFAKNYRR